MASSSVPSPSNPPKMGAGAECFYRTQPALYEDDFSPAGFEWIDFKDNGSSVISYLRRGKSAEKYFWSSAISQPVPRYHYHVGIPRGGFWRELLTAMPKKTAEAGMEISAGSIRPPSPITGNMIPFP